MRNYPSIGIQIPEVYLPRPGIDSSRWAVIACDQFTSQPEYWQKVQEIVADAPSTFHLILPEVFLGTPEEQQRVQTTQQAMKDYLSQGLLQKHEGMILVERCVDGKTRRGIILALDLEKYDFNKGSKSLIRATEGTILDRLPPRMKIREGAVLELPHILVLIDDPQRTVIEPLVQAVAGQSPIYDFDLMLDSGHLRGYSLQDKALESQVVSALEELANPTTFQAKYGVGQQEGVLLFAMGDGNHSLATAKAIWEKIKSQVSMDHPARYALVEIENVHDEGLEFEPIHRVLFDVHGNILEEINQYFGCAVRFQPTDTIDEMVRLVDETHNSDQLVGMVDENRCGVLHISDPATNLAVGTLQGFLDGFLKAGGAAKIDYVHGRDVVMSLGRQPGNTGFYVPGVEKSDLFKTVILDGALPRKTFSMGEAHEKRFYMECRKIA